MIKILTAEQSQELWEKDKKERLSWSTSQIIIEAKIMFGLPDAGNTKYVLPSQYEEFYKWLETSEARTQWELLPRTLHLARYWSWKYDLKLSDKEIDELINGQIWIGNEKGI